ncbi:hypothetical protein D3C83_61000 [compost metagenome]
MPGTPSTSQRIICRQKFSWVMSSSDIETCICQFHVSCSVSAMALPRPYCCQASATRDRPPSSMPLSSTVAPGFGCSAAFTLVTPGSSSQRDAEACSVGAIWVTA